MRDECLNREQLWTLTEARVVIEDYRCQYNHHRSHSKLGLRIGAEGGDDSVAVQFRHHHVAKNQVGLFLLRQLDSDLAVLGGQWVKLLKPEDGRQVATHLRFVFNHQNLFHKLSQPHRHRRAFAQFALHFDFAALQSNTTLYDHQAKSGAEVGSVIAGR